MKRNITLPLALVLIAAPLAAQSNSAFLANYKGTPYTDTHHPIGAQPIPGIVQCAYYDRGGEGIAYHDSDAKNNGSGALNPADGSYLNEFRMHEGVDTSYTKFHDPHVQIDNNPYNFVVPPDGQLYVGWTVPGEWFNLTVNTAHAGRYTADLLYTSNRGGSISIDVNGIPGHPITIPSTFSTAEPIAWRQWHHWNLLPRAATLHLPAGRSVLTIHILTQGQMNLATLDFKPAP
ncbi:MAG: hypothetical protein WB439_08995 [Acidobacteriaceae bacterium]